MMNLQVGRYTLWTQTAFIHRKIVARLESDDVIVVDQEIHAALHGAVRAMRGHDLFNHAIGAPGAIRCVVQMRAEGVDDLFAIFDLAHSLLLRIMTARDPRPLKYTRVLLRQRGVRQAAYDS